MTGNAHVRFGGRAGETDRRPTSVPHQVRANLANKALDEVRRAHWNYLRASVDAAIAKQLKAARWALLKAAERLSDAQADQLAAIRRSGTAVWRAYCLKLKEALRAVFAGDLPPEQVAALLESWTGRAQRSRLEPFVKLQRTLRSHHDGIIAATARGLSQGRAEGSTTASG